MTLGPQFSALPPLSLYIHIPWCIRKCPYCDFNSHEHAGGLPEQDYVDALMCDLEVQLPDFWGRTIHTVFFGGGTPSLFSARAISDILAGVRARTRLSPQAEITLEANPGTFEMQKFAEFKSAGVTRLSIGIQSFNDAHLRALGRVHDGAEAARAVEIGLATVGNVNLDLMFALPATRTGARAGGAGAARVGGELHAAQTMAECESDIRTALAFGTPHLSCYQLTLEPNTVFAKKPPALPDHDQAADMQLHVESLLAEAGYEHYETSAYARPGMRCQHNLNYWGFGDYVAIGAGAHGKLSMPGGPSGGDFGASAGANPGASAGAKIVRTARARQPQDYMQKARSADPSSCVFERREVKRSEVGFEFMLNALRLNEGFPVAWFAERTGYPVSLVHRALDAAEHEGLLVRTHERIVPTEQGRRFLNRMLEKFLE